MHVSGGGASITEKIWLQKKRCWCSNSANIYISLVVFTLWEVAYRVAFAFNPARRHSFSGCDTETSAHSIWATGNVVMVGTHGAATTTTTQTIPKKKIKGKIFISTSLALCHSRAAAAAPQTKHTQDIIEVINFTCSIILVLCCAVAETVTFM